MKREDIQTLLDEDALLLDPEYDKALVGAVERCSSRRVACYDAEKVVMILMKLNKWDVDTAQEFFDFNMAGAWLGEGTPFFLIRP